MKVRAGSTRPASARIRTSSSRLRAKLAEYMRAVRAGKEIVVTDRDRPVARLLRFDEGAPEQSQHATVARPRDPTAPRLGKVEVRAIRYRGRPTSEILREDRDRR